jgi:hypothetical protein
VTPHWTARQNRNRPIGNRLINTLEMFETTVKSKKKYIEGIKSGLQSGNACYQVTLFSRTHKK